MSPIERYQEARQFVVELGASGYLHSGQSLLDHLDGTYALLQTWGLPEPICLAGLFHNVYGTATVSAKLAEFERRETIRSVIGAAAERIVFLFATTTRVSLFASMFPHGAGCLRDARTDTLVEVDEEMLVALFHLVVANWLEQHQRGKAMGTGLEYLALRQRLVPAARAMLEANQRGNGGAGVRDVNLASLLSWNDAVETEGIVVELEDAYLSVLASALHDRVGLELWKDLVALEGGGLRRILQAPETAWRVWGTPDNSSEEMLASYVDAAVHMERWRSGQAIELHRASWSAEGDLYLPAGNHDSSAHAAELFDRSAPYRAHRLDGGIVVDFDSPQATRSLTQNSFRPTAYGPPEVINPAQREDLIAKLHGAINILRFGSPVAFRFVLSNVRTVSPRKQTNPKYYPFGFNGSSTATYMGRAILNNAHHAVITPGHVAQSLLHEAIHIHLYKREFFHATVLNWVASDAQRIRSPWSGNQISPYAFAHAGLVFYGLVMFFAREAVRGLAGELVSTHYVDNALAGFRAELFDPVLTSIAAGFSPSMNAHLRSVADGLCDRFPSGPSRIHELKALDDAEFGV